MELLRRVLNYIRYFALSSYLRSCNWLPIKSVVLSQSAAVPAPQQTIFGAKGWIFWQFLSATTSPPVALVSAPTTTPPLKTTPQMVVPVLVNFGCFKLVCLAKNEFLKVCKNKRIDTDLFNSFPRNVNGVRQKNQIQEGSCFDTYALSFYRSKTILDMVQNMIFSGENYGLIKGPH